VRRLRILHAIHDFLPRHRAGSEIYAFNLCRELAHRHDVFVVAAEYDPTARHGALRWRAHEALPIVEVVNNWEARTFEDTYASRRITDQLVHVLDATRPDVLHIHNLLNLSFELPRHARERGIRTAATLHDYTLVCASGGQRVHVAESHVCHDIDPVRCSRCFADTPFRAQIAAAALENAPGGRMLRRAATIARGALPVLTDRAARHLPLTSPARPDDISARLTRARRVFGEIELFVAPSASIGAEFVNLGVDPQRIELSDYGFVHEGRRRRLPADGPVRFGFIGSMVWHKGAHVLLEAARLLRGDFQVLVAGDPQVGPGYHAQLQGAASGLPVRFSGPFDAADVPHVYGNLDVLVVPSLWPENSPLVIHEAFMHGVAVVGSRIGGIPGLIQDGVNGFTYEAFSPEALASVLQRFLDDRGLAARLASCAPAVKTISEDAQDWESRYNALLDRPGPARI
jgi:glycosyltransferase involved in cell wall biosynthesis